VVRSRYYDCTPERVSQKPPYGTPAARCRDPVLGRAPAAAFEDTRDRGGEVQKPIQQRALDDGEPRRTSVDAVRR
jgi:hypothetical protein